MNADVMLMREESGGQGSPAKHRGLFADGRFFLLFLGSSVSLFGSAIVPLALTFALLERHYSVTDVGLTLAAESVPMFLLLALGGVVGDRMPRRSVMVASDLLRCAAQAFLAFRLVGGHPAIGEVMSLCVLIGAGNAFYGPALAGLTIEVAGNRLHQANSLMSISGGLAVIVGPVLSGFLVTLGNAPLALAIDALSYAFSAACLISVRSTYQKPSARTALKDDFHEGLHELKRHRWLWIMTAQVGLLNAAIYAPVAVLGPAMFFPLPSGVSIWATLVAATGAGGALGGILSVKVRPRSPLLAIEMCIIALATPLILLASGASVIWLSAGCAVFGFGGASIAILFQTAVQSRIPLTAIGRVDSLIGLFTLALTPLGFSLSGVGSKMIGTTGVFWAGALLMIASVCLALRSSEIRNFSADGRIVR